MKLPLRFLAFALGTGLAFVAPAQAQVGVNVQIGPPAWGPAVPQNTQYYYIPEIDGYYDIYNGVYLVFDGVQWVTLPYLDGYDPYYFHPVPVSYIGPRPWLYIGSYRSRYPQYVTGYRRGGFGYGGHYDRDYGAGRVYGYDHGGRGYGNNYNNGGHGNYGGGRPPQGQGAPGNPGGPGRGGYGGGQPGGNPQPGGQPGPGRNILGNPGGNPQPGGNPGGPGGQGGFGGGGQRGGGNPGGGGRRGGR